MALKRSFQAQARVLRDRKQNKCKGLKESQAFQERDSSNSLICNTTNNHSASWAFGGAFSWQLLSWGFSHIDLFVCGYHHLNFQNCVIIFLLSVSGCVHRWVCTCGCVSAGVPGRQRCLISWSWNYIECCEPPALGARNWTWDLWKISQHSSLLSHLHSLSSQFYKGTRAGGAAQWDSNCWAYMRSWVHCLLLRKEGRKTEKEEQEPGETKQLCSLRANIWTVVLVTAYRMTGQTQSFIMPE